MPLIDPRPWLLLALCSETTPEYRNQYLQAATRELLAQAGTILRNAGAPELWLSQATELLDLLQRQKLPKEIQHKADACLQWADAANNFLLTPADVAYPPLLLTTAQPPPVLFGRGNPQVLSLPQLAIVGSRKPSPDGIKLARSFARELGRAGYVITSGLALGIDAAGHEGALRNNAATVAVLGTGLNMIYPEQHQALARSIVDQGALISEFSPDTPVRPWQFPRRNRIISGLAHGVLVVEAALSSGSLITARLAAEQGRAVFAIPGSIHNPMSRGCHHLIRQGAILVESVADILEELGALVQWEQQRLEAIQGSTDELLPESISGQQELTSLLTRIAYNPVTVDELAETLQLGVEVLLPRLLQLELAGTITHQATGYVRTS